MSIPKAMELGKESPVVPSRLLHIKEQQCSPLYVLKQVFEKEPVFDEI